MRFAILIAAFAVGSTFTGTGCFKSVEPKSAKGKLNAETVSTKHMPGTAKADADTDAIREAPAKAEADAELAKAELAKARAETDRANAKAARAEAELAKAKADAEMKEAKGRQDVQPRDPPRKPASPRLRPVTKDYPIVGMWVGSHKVGAMETTQVFNARADGKYQVIATSRFQLIEVVQVRKGTFTYEDGVLTWSGSFAGGDFDGVPDTGVGTVTWDGKDQFTLTFTGGKITYKRKPGNGE